MRHSILFRNAALALLVTFAVDARAATINWIPVGNPGNAADSTGYGAVAYSYNIDKFDVTNQQYVAFLNAKDPSGANALGLYNSNMSDISFGGITFLSGNAPGSKYFAGGAETGREGHPVNFVTWYDAIRYANWLNNGQGNGDTETGAYTLGALGTGGIPINGDSITRNAGATVFLPSEDEWYKAAYYNPATHSYFQYPTSSDTRPTGSGPTALPNHANILSGGPNNLTTAGAYTGTKSPYGAFDMGGNVNQWNEALVGDLLRGLRGGSFGTGGGLFSSDRFYGDPSADDDAGIGFRVAETPEPSSLVLAALGFIGLIAWRLRRR